MSEYGCVRVMIKVKVMCVGGNIMLVLLWRCDVVAVFVVLGM